MHSRGVMYDPIADFYSRPQLGSGIAIYQGNRRQAGGGIFQSIARFAVPILRKIKDKIFGMAPAVGAKALEVVSNSINDVRRNNKTSFIEALRDNTRDTLRQQGLLPPAAQDGSGINRDRKRRKKARRVGVVKKRKTTTVNNRKKKKRTVYRDVFAKALAAAEA